MQGRLRPLYIRWYRLLTVSFATSQRTSKQENLKHETTVTEEGHEKVNPSRILFILALTARIVSADTISHTGTLSSPQSIQDFTLTVASASAVTSLTYAFGGVTNAAGRSIAPARTDSFLAIFSGTRSSATI